MLEELRHQPTHDLSVTVQECVDTVYRVVAVSRNLKGDIACELRLTV